MVFIDFEHAAEEGEERTGYMTLFAARAIQSGMASTVSRWHDWESLLYSLYHEYVIQLKKDVVTLLGMLTCKDSLFEALLKENDKLMVERIGQKKT